MYEVAKARMAGFCRICKICDGKLCAGEVPGMGGLGTGSSFRNNILALGRVKLNMRLIHGVTQVDTRVDFLGKEYNLPILAAPIGGVSFNMWKEGKEEEYISGIIEGTRGKNVVGCTGDGVNELVFSSGLGAIEDFSWGIPFIKPWKTDELYEKMEKAIKVGLQIIGMDIDAAGLITLAKQGRPVTAKSMKELGEIISYVHKAGCKFILKGIMSVSDAKKALELGVDALYVSNHGGRVLDHTPGVSEVLPKIADFVNHRMPIIADGGVRTGVDVLKMLALGADIVGIGRPFSHAVINNGVEEVKRYIEKLDYELMSAMVMTGTETVKDVSSSILYVDKYEVENYF